MCIRDSNRSPSETETDIKAHVAAAMAIEMAWAVLAPYINVTLNIEPNEVDTVKQKIVDILVSIAEYWTVFTKQQPRKGL